MCGIAGFSISRRDASTNPNRLARTLLAESESRGRHASGAAWVEDDTVWFDKAPIPGRTYGPLLDLSRLATNAVFHTRYATQGDPKVNANNHPFALPNVTGVHNGIVTNDDDIFDLLNVERTCETDSEAIFALLAHGGFDHPTEALELVEGDATVAWLETDQPDTLHVARLNGRPLALGQTVTGTLVFASTMTILKAAAAKADVKLPEKLLWDVPEGTYLRIKQGIIHDVVRFTPMERRPKVKVVSGKRGATYASGWYGAGEDW